MEFSRPEYWSGEQFSSPGDLPNPGIEARPPTLQADSLPTEPSGKPKNTEAGSPSLLQGIFPTQELNQCLLHCRQILYQLRYLGKIQNNKGHIQKTHSKHYSQWWKTESIFRIRIKIRNKIRVPTLTTIIQHSFGSPSHSNQRRKRNKRNPDRKIRSKTYTVWRWHNTVTCMYVF